MKTARTVAFPPALILFPLIMATLFLSGCSFKINRGNENAVGLAAAKTAAKYIGTPYVYGGRSPRGFDCSGLALYVYKQHGVKLPPTSKTQARAGKAVTKKELLPGDLVFFRTSAMGGVGHVGIYVGDGKFIHAPGTGKKVKKAGLDEKYFKARYHSARRVNARSM